MCTFYNLVFFSQGAQGQFTQTQKNFEQTVISGQGQGVSQGKITFLFLICGYITL